ncbi:hypothetical protein T12_5482 [Trichinella patagoniensis]|uniref:Uncharacterized protein n=1 Tax=Trichinella patagoniensis TaxID=990121 RepID=A0A0V0Z190_9BILA|nr:hypothetical protein T12_5482 [Trichinella patagoniensis]
MLSHEARTDANQCSPGVSMAFSRRPSVPLVITNGKKEFDMTAMKYVNRTGRCTSQHFVLDSNGLRHHQKICLVAADGTRLRSNSLSLSNCVSYVRNCEDESRILNDNAMIPSNRIIFLRFYEF